ncbi:MAG: hypothetical protein JAZ18_01805 [Candidatus Thiodiazotropha endolucinida]|nr:hypothetical protein [Candidatus Thiodiazotropha endolucinida]
MCKRKCPHCGNRYHWHHAFSKFGYDDGEGKVETPDIARVLQRAGFTVEYASWPAHNTIISSIRKNGTEYMPLSDPQILIGYDDPANYLPQHIQNLLNTKIPPEDIFL